VGVKFCVGLLLGIVITIGSYDIKIKVILHKTYCYYDENGLHETPY